VTRTLFHATDEISKSIGVHPWDNGIEFNPKKKY
jgi:hypothetical protein